MRQSEKREALALFPDALEGYILPTINDLRESVRLTRARAEATLRRSQDFEDGWLLREWVKVADLEDILRAERRIRALEGYLPPKKAHSPLTEDDITRAREADIVSIALDGGLKVRKTGTRHVARCPYHAEKSASFVLYPNQTFYCFGCNVSGDSITLARKLFDLSFVEAVLWITKH